MTTLVGWRFEKASNANEGNVRELSRMGGDEGTLDFAAEGRRGRGSRDFVLISATSAPLPLSAKPDRLSRPWLEMSFADRSNANEGNVGELSRMDPN